jgi:hypothetical protein
MLVSNSTSVSTVAKAVAISMVAWLFVFPMFEPVVGQAVEDQFTVRQEITSEISFYTGGTNVVMSPALGGITGGTATGGTQVSVLTNDSQGYNMTIKASGTIAMVGETQGGFIQNYTPNATTVPEYAWSVDVNTGEFGYTISASTTADLDQSFLDTGAICDAGSADTSGSTSCWYYASDTPYMVVNRSSETAGSGSTSTLFFQVQLTSNPIPAIPEDFYTATTTLTAVTN